MEPLAIAVTRTRVVDVLGAEVAHTGWRTAPLNSVGTGTATMDGTGRVARQLGRVGFFARVSVECTSPPIEADPPACSFTEDVPDTWRAAAIVGAAWALEIAGARVLCRITAINGMHNDTNPTVVAIAAARAVWAATAFRPSDDLRKQVDDAVLASHAVSEDEIGLPPITGGRQ